MRVVSVFVSVATAFSLVGCSSATAPNAAPPAGSLAADASSPAAVPSSTTSSKPRFTVRTEGARIRQFALPTFAKFIADPYVSNVIVGTVRDSRVLVSQPGTVVETILTVAVDSSKLPASRTVTVRESGGVVTVEQVRDNFESKLGRKLTPKELAERVDYQTEDGPHADAGDAVLLVVTDDKSGIADYVALTRLAAAGITTARSGGAAQFAWPGEAPNAAWAKAVIPSELF